MLRNTFVIGLRAAVASLCLVSLSACSSRNIHFDRDGVGIQNGLDNCLAEARTVNFSGCTSLHPPPPPKPFEGRWEGTATFTIQGEAPVSVPSLTLARTLDGKPGFTLCGDEEDLFVEGASVQPTGSVHWKASDPHRCPEVTLPTRQCDRPLFDSATATLWQETGTLEVVASGYLVSCNAREGYVEMTYHFTGAKVR